MEFGSVELDSAAGYVDGSADLLACVLGDAEHQQQPLAWKA